MDDKPVLLMDEPIEYGPIHFTFAGDPEAAKGNIDAARRIMGAMKTYTGVNARVSNGEPGGFYSATKVLPDGTRIDVSTNDGNDTARITVPTTQQEASEWQGQVPVDVPRADEAVGIDGVHTEAEAEHTEAEAEHTSYDYTPDEPGETIETVPPPTGSYEPYLWIGARIVSGPLKSDGTFRNKLHVCVWEPPARPGADPVILSNRNEFIERTDPPYDSATYPLGAWTQFVPADDYEHGIAYTDDKLFMVLPDNTLGLPMRVPDWQPDKDEDISWDVIFIADPKNALLLETPDGPMASSQAGGYYMVKVMVVGDDCGEDRFGTVQVELRVMTGQEQYRVDSTTQFSIEHFTKYRMGILPMGWFKPPPPVKPNATVCDTCSTPQPDFGANPHGPHWWQGAAGISVAPLQVEVPLDLLVLSGTFFSRDGEVELPPTGFEPGGWPSHADLCPACVQTTTSYYVLSYEVPEPRRVSVGGDYPGCGPITTDITKFSLVYYYLTNTEPILPYFLAGKVAGATFTGTKSGGSKYVSFTTERTADDSYTYALSFGPAWWWSESTRNYPQYGAGVPMFGFTCQNRTTEALQVQYDTDYHAYLHTVMDVYPYEWYDEGMNAYYKIVVVTDKNGKHTDTVTFVSRDEYESVPFVDFVGRVVTVCGRVEQD